METVAEETQDRIVQRLDRRLDTIEGETIPSLSERVRRLELRILVYLPIAVTLLTKAWDFFLAAGVTP